MVELLPVRDLPLIEPGDPLADLIVAACGSPDSAFEDGDVLVVAQKIISKAEGRIVRLDTVTPSPRALELAEQSQKDPRLVELILQESREVVRVRPGLIVVEDCRGFICANAGIDRSNVQQHGRGEEVALLPLDPDASARALRARIQQLTGRWVGIVVNDSHGRAFRQGTVGVAIGVAGIQALSDRRGVDDLTGYTLEHTIIGLADEIAAAGSLLMGAAAEGVPVVVVRGLDLEQADSTARHLQRPREQDLFR